MNNCYFACWGGGAEVLSFKGLGGGFIGLARVTRLASRPEGVVEPMMNGMGGDLMAQVLVGQWQEEVKDTSMTFVKAMFKETGGIDPPLNNEDVPSKNEC